TVLALDCAIAGFESWKRSAWAGCGAACAAAILLRPDGAMLPFVILLYLTSKLFLPEPTTELWPTRRQLLGAALWIVAISVLPLVPWTLRNWHVFHRLEPLAPRYANEEGEFVPMSFNRWVRTWMVDYTSVEEIYWPVPGSPVDASRLPDRAFDAGE